MFKFVIGLFPRKLRQHFKKNVGLTALYSKLLRQAGIIQNIPTLKTMSAAYVKNLKLQTEKINQLSINNVTTPVLLVIVVAADKHKLATTLQSINNLANSKQVVLFYCAQEKKSLCNKILKKLDGDSFLGSVFSDRDGGKALCQVIKAACFVIFEGDSLHPDYAKVLSHELKLTTKIAYVDSDRRSDDGERHSPDFYPDWNPDLQLSTSYIQSGIWLSDVQLLFTNSLQKLSYTCLSEWLIRLYLASESHFIQHVPWVLLHRVERFKMCGHEYARLLSAKAKVSVKQEGEVLALNWTISAPPLVSIIIPTKNAKALVQACIESIIERTTYRHFEILLVDNNSDDPECLSYFENLATHPQISLLKYPYEFNYSAINNFAVNHANGEVIALVNNDIEVIEPDWLTYMVGHVMRSDIGCVGAKLLYANDLIQHAGVVMGYGGGAGHAHKYFPADHPGYLNRISATHNFSAVTAACLLVKKSDYQQVGGLNEVEFKVAFNDVDFCLRVLGLGRRNLYCAEAALYHHESVSRGFEDTAEKQARFNSEVAHMKILWQSFIDHDPAYNPNLTLRYENFALKDE
jgi:GT2 family glycosyltransferase/nitrate reductase NapAB chaperone NapD